MKNQNLLLFLVLALFAGMVVVGCGSDDEAHGGLSNTNNDGNNSGDADSDADSDGDADGDTDGDGDSDGDSDTDSDTDSDSDGDVTPSECDGPDVDCYSECWGCALNSATCLPTLEECMLDTTCATYYDCKDQECCGGNDDCLTGDDWEECMAGCAEESGATDATLELYNEIDKCVACDACSESCAKGESQDFAMCAKAEDMNTVDNPCYEDQAEEGETACFSWAGWGGPCSTAVSNCKNEDACATLEECVNATWEFDDWSARQDVCFEEAGAAAEELYWAYMQCIYCDACDVACLKDAGSKNCAEYTPGK